MKTADFHKSLTSSKINENISKFFGGKVKLEKYSREQLEDIRNKVRTEQSQFENSAGYNELLANEAYQKNQAILQLLNTRIKEMLGEDIKKLRDKIVELSEGKKGVKVAKHPRGSKGSGDDKTGDGKKDFDDVQVARMVAGGVPKKKAIAKATSDNFKEGAGEADDTERKPTKKTGERDVKLPSGATVKARTYQGHQSQKADKEASKNKNKDLDEASKKCNHTPKGEMCPVHGMKECGSMQEGKDEFGKGKNFEKIAKAAGGGTKGKKIAGAVRAEKIKQAGGKVQYAKESINVFKHNVRFVNESLQFLLAEDEEGKAKAITAAGDIVNDFTSWMQRVGQYQTKTMIELADAIKADFGAAEAEAFKQAVAPALSATLETLTSQREAISSAVAVLAGEATPEEPMGNEPAPDMAGPEEPGMDMSAPDEMNPEPAGDEFGASDAAAGAGTTGREVRESTFARKLAESHSIMAKLAR